MPRTTKTDIDTLLSQASQRNVEPDFYRRLEARVMQQTLPPQPRALIDQLVDWLLPKQRAAWRPLLAASCPLLFGIVLANFYHFGIPSSTTLESSIESWDDELMMLSFSQVEALDASLFEQERER